MPGESEKEKLQPRLGAHSSGMNWTTGPWTRTLLPLRLAAAETHDKANQLNSAALPAQGNSYFNPLRGPQRPPSPLLPPSYFLQRKGPGVGLRTEVAPARGPSCKIHRKTDTWAQHPVWQQENLLGVKGREREVKPINSSWNH